MKSIQYILIVLCLVPIILIRYGSKTSGRASYRVGFVIFICLFLISVAYPNLTTRVANAIGVGRGTDLIVYMTTFALICFSLILIIKFERLQREITQLVRRIALEKVQKPDNEL